MKLLRLAVVFLSLAALLPAAGLAADAPVETTPNRAEAYYNYSMGNLYAELATMYGGRAEYLARAIDHYKAALKADPNAAIVGDELAGLYIRAGRLNEAVTELEERLKKEPNALDAHRILGRIYLQLIGDQVRGRLNEEMLKRALEQYQKIVEIDPKDADSWLLLGRLHRASQNSTESEKAFKKVLDLEPDNEDAVTGLALVYSGLGDNKRAAEMLKALADRRPSLRTLTSLVDAYETMRDYSSAAEVLKRAVELEPSNRELRGGLAEDLALAGKVDEALKVYEQLAEEDPDDAEAFLRISQLCRQKGDFAKARQALDRARKTDPENMDVRFSEVSLLEAEGRNAEAISVMRQIVDSTEKRTYTPSERANRLVLLERLGLLYRNNEQYSEAVATFRSLPELDESAGPRSAAQVIETYRQAKDFTHALSEAEDAYKKFPDDRMVGLTRASLLAETGKGDQAAAEVKKLFEDEKDKEGWLALAQVHEKAKNYREMGRALDRVEKLIFTDDDKVNLYFMRGAMHERMKEYDSAEREFRRALTLDPDNSSILNYLGYMLADRDVRLDEAYKMISRAVELEPQNGAFLDSLGWVYYRMDKLEEAETYLRRALQRVSRDPTVRDHLGDVLARMGKLREAIAEWQVSLKEWEASSPSDKDEAEIAKIGKKLEGARVRLAQEASSPARNR